jgi:hypothetical protein
MQDPDFLPFRIPDIGLNKSGKNVLSFFVAIKLANLKIIFALFLKRCRKTFRPIDKKFKCFLNNSKNYS